MINQNKFFAGITLCLILVFLVTGCDMSVGDFQVDADGYATTRLSNGITLLMNQDQTTALTSARVLFGGGVLIETSDNNGITNLMTKMLLKGNSSMTGAQISEQLDFLGANVSVICRRDYSAISFTSLTVNFPDVLDIMTYCVLSPTFPADELVKVKHEVVGDIVSLDDDQSAASSKLYWKTVYGDQGYGLPPLGTQESIESISAADLQAHYDTYVGGANAVVSISTDLDIHELHATIEHKFGQLKQSAAPVQPPSLTLQPTHNGYIANDRNQSFVYLGVALDHLTAEEVPNVILLNEIMGANVGSRLWFLRQKEKLAYNVFTQYTLDKHDTLFRAGIGTDTLKVKTALASLDREWNKMVSDGVTAEELTDARINMKNNLIFSIDIKRNRANNMAFYHWIGYNHRFVFDLIEQADKVTLAELNTFIKERFSSDRRYTSIVGKN